MQNTIRASGVVSESIVDGPGIRYVVFTQGCPHNCEGCHNPQTHSFNGGKELPISRVIDDIRDNPLISGVTFSGGEPLCQPQPLLELARQVDSLGKNVILYSGYTFEELLEKNDPDINGLLDHCLYLIDGRFDSSKKTLGIKFRGSSNQRILDARLSLHSGRAVEAMI